MHYLKKRIFIKDLSICTLHKNKGNRSTIIKWYVSESPSPQYNSGHFLLGRFASKKRSFPTEMSYLQLYKPGEPDLVNTADGNSHVDLSRKDQMETEYSPVQGLGRTNQRGKKVLLKCTAKGQSPVCLSQSMSMGITLLLSWTREQQDQRSSHKQGQGLSSAKLCHQQTAVMQNEVLCISAAMTVGRAQTSHLACVWLSVQPPPIPCLSSIPVLEGRHVNTAANDRHLALQKYLQRGDESIFHFRFGGTWIIYCFQIY